MRKYLAFLLLLALIPSSIVFGQAENPWNEIFTEDGNLNPNLIDLGETTEHPDWMSVELPFGQTLDLPANYHRFQTPSGNIVILPSASTLFFMAMNPGDSGLNNSYGMIGNGYASLISFLGSVVGDNLNWSQVLTDHPEYATPDDFWGAVLRGEQSAWTYFSGWGFITNLLQMSWEDVAFRTAYLLYLNGAVDCSAIPGGCSGIVSPPGDTNLCPTPTVNLQQPVLSIQKIAPTYPLVLGQDPTSQRGADIEALVAVPPVIFTWYEPIYEELSVCRFVQSGEVASCSTGDDASVLDGVIDLELVFKECKIHVERLKDSILSFQATATLDPASQDWITGQLGETHYGAFVHQAGYSLVPGFGAWSASCSSNGTCSASGQALNVPFSDPGTFNLRLEIQTSGTQFRGIPITQPRQLAASGELQVYVTLPALVP